MSAAVMTACTPRISSARETSTDTRRPCATELRRIAACSMRGAIDRRRSGHARGAAQIFHTLDRRAYGAAGSMRSELVEGRFCTARELGVPRTAADIERHQRVDLCRFTITSISISSFVDRCAGRRADLDRRDAISL